MNALLKEGLKQEAESFKLNATKIFQQFKALSVVTFGWLLMVFATPYAANHVSPNGIETFLGGICVVLLFILGATFTRNGVESFEKIKDNKSNCIDLDK